MNYGLSTRAVHAGQDNDPLTGATSFPVYQTSTYGQEEIGGKPTYCYSRTGNPTRTALEANLAALEGGRFGLAFASGMAAINNVLNLLKEGDHVVACEDLYGGAYRIFTKLYRKFGVAFTFTDATRPENVRSAIRPNTRLLWLETPSNPLLRVTDIAACAELAAHNGILVVVDNTFATPVLQRPLTLGADIVVHSTTKYLNGHADVIGGALITDREELHQELKFFQNCVGAIPSPHDCYLTLRGIKTLQLRVRHQCQTAQRLAETLLARPEVARVHFPGLSDHPQREVVERQMQGPGAVVTFELRGGEAAARRLVKGCQLWTLAESLGGVKALLCHPPTMTHAAVEPEIRRSVGIGDGLIRLSPGLEDAEDLIADLAEGLRAASAEARPSKRKTPGREEVAAA